MLCNILCSCSLFCLPRPQEEENSRVSGAKRRLQREMDELTEQNETLQRDLAAAKKR